MPNVSTCTSRGQFGKPLRGSLDTFESNRDGVEKLLAQICFAILIPGSSFTNLAFGFNQDANVHRLPLWE